MRLFALIFTILGLLAAPLAAKEVTISHNGLTLRGNLEPADGKSIADGVLLMVHGTLAHHEMETIKGLQKNLKDRGVSTLAITLSLGIDARRGMFDCNQPMRHTQADAVDEIEAWVRWLMAHGAKTIWLFGHSRGGAQAAWFAAKYGTKATAKLVLLAPMVEDQTPEKLAAKYKKRFNADLEAVLKEAKSRLGSGQLMETPGVLYCKDAKALPKTVLSYHLRDARRDTLWWMKILKMPVLVITGGQDEIFPGQQAQFAPLADGKRVVVKQIDDADHFFLDFASEDAADAIAEFLKP